MAKATIKSKSGALITIEGSEAEVSKILLAFEHNTSAGDREPLKIAKAKQTKKDSQKRSTPTDLIIELKDEGFFQKPKGLGEISHALEEKGFIYPVTTLSGVALGLVKKKILGRKKVEGKWVYGK